MCSDVTRVHSMRGSSPRVRSICSWEGADAKITRGPRLSASTRVNASAAVRPAADLPPLPCHRRPRPTLDARSVTDICNLLPRQGSRTIGAIGSPTPWSTCIMGRDIRAPR